MDFQLIIPCYNEEKSLETMLVRTVHSAQLAGYDSSRFQLIIVDNGSHDESNAVLQKLRDGEYRAWFMVVPIGKNLGYGDGIWQGLQASTADYIGWTHADEQCDPKDAFDALKHLLKVHDNNALLVKGKRRHRGILDYLWSRCFELAVFFLLHVYIFEINAQPKIFSRALLAELPAPPVDFAFDLYVLLHARKAGWRIDSIPVIFAPRMHGQSRWAFSLRNRLKTGWKMLTYIETLRKPYSR